MKGPCPAYALLEGHHNDPLTAKLNKASKRIGELVMEKDLMRPARAVRHP